MSADKENDSLSSKPSDSSAVIADLADFARNILEYISKNPNIFGGADIFILDFQNPQYRAGVLAAVLTGLVDADRRPAIDRFVVVVPQGLNAAACEAQAWGEMVATLRLLASREIEPSKLDWIRSRFRIVTASDRWFRSVLDIVKAQPERTAVVVTHAASYRDNNINPYIAPCATAPTRPEDVWVPQLHGLAVAVIEVVRERKLYVALDANQLNPRREALTNLLASIDGCGVMGSSRDGDPDSILAERVDQWDEWIRAGRLGRALGEMEQLPAAFNSNKAYLRIQLMYKAGQFPQALQAIREEIAHGCQFDASSRVKLARIAQDANASRLAHNILASAVDELESFEDLESALATAHEVGSSELEERVVRRTEAMFPESPGLKKRRRRALLAARDYSGIANMASEESEGQANYGFYNRLACFLSGPDIPDYHALIASAGGDISQVDAYRIACVRDALARKLIWHALDLAIPIPTTLANESLGERLLLQVIEDILLFRGSSKTLQATDERIQEAMLSLLQRLASDPKNQALRIRLSRLLQPSVAGRTGLALIVFLVLQLASPPIRLEKWCSFKVADPDWLMDHKPFLKAAFEWLDSESPVVMGKFILPETLLTEQADEVISAMILYLEETPLDSVEDARDVQQWLALAAAVAPYSSDPDIDLRLMRLVAGRLAMSGYTQAARDLAEHTLLNSAATPRRRRLGWFAMADVYHRCHNYIEGLIAIGCTLAADDAADEEQIWQEIACISRLLRDCGLHDQALLAIRNARQLLHHMELSALYSHRLDTLELQIRMLRIGIAKPGKAEIETLLSDVVRNGEAVLGKHDMTEPAAFMLGQLLRQARLNGVSIPQNAYDVCAELRRHSRGGFTSLLAAVSADEPSADDLLAVMRASAQARYSDDVGFDMLHAVMIAGRVLTRDDYIRDSVQTSFALELLADWGVAIPGWDETSQPPPAPKKVSEPAEIACSISLEGISVVQVGFDTFGRLVRISAVGGRLEAPVREPSDIMLEERLRRWAIEHPYRYGVDDTTMNLFYTTTADLRLSGLPTGPIVIVADTSLQCFPPNLFYVDNEFAGRTRPIAATPSLAWLQAARAKGSIGNGRYCAWISTAAVGSEKQTLLGIAQRLEPVFIQYGFTVNNSPTLPAEFAGASMAVITAHGSIHPEGRYFQVVSDEGVLRVAAWDLAEAVRNVGIVILFVCSGGRADKHPVANTTLGLAKQILDRGCAAVIASPWPLDAQVPAHWLPEFLQQWSEGKSIIESNFAANQVVDRNFSQDPARGLAMTVFGNPLQRRR
jgi:hypothetical protein